jgi:hypothetical protein
MCCTAWGRTTLQSEPSHLPEWAVAPQEADHCPTVPAIVPRLCLPASQRGDSDSDSVRGSNTSGAAPSANMICQPKRAQDRTTETGQPLTIRNWKVPKNRPCCSGRDLVDVAVAQGNAADQDLCGTRKIGAGSCHHRAGNYQQQPTPANENGQSTWRSLCRRRCAPQTVASRQKPAPVAPVTAPNASDGQSKSVTGLASRTA